MVSTTRTVNPLPFEHLEPKRFEDLVRQLAYEFKDWRRLEATGRSGSDDGFDARGYEKRSSFDIPDVDETDATGDDLTTTDRLWLIQCKREKSITPAKMAKHLTEITINKDEPLHGLVFAAACDFSKKTRDCLATWCREKGMNEWQIWGNAELEDMLFQPKNDGLLFAYFGISLTIRRRSQTTELRRQIAIKKKLKRVIDDSHNKLVLLRDIDDQDYPDPPDEGIRARWRVRPVIKLSTFGLMLKISQRPAWLDKSDTKWDAAFGVTGVDMTHGQDEWLDLSEDEQERNRIANATWESLPDNEKAWMRINGIIPYANIVLIDDVGDEFFEGPHVYVTGWSEGYQFAKSYIRTVEHGNNRIMKIDTIDSPGRVSVYPETIRHFKGRKTGY